MTKPSRKKKKEKRLIVECRKDEAPNPTKQASGVPLTETGGLSWLFEQGSNLELLVGSYSGQFGLRAAVLYGKCRYR